MNTRYSDINYKYSSTHSSLAHYARNNFRKIAMYNFIFHVSAFVPSAAFS